MADSSHYVAPAVSEVWPDLWSRALSSLHRKGERQREREISSLHRKGEREKYLPERVENEKKKNFKIKENEK